MPAPKTIKSSVSETAALADELGALEKEMAPHAQKLARIDLLKKTLRGACIVPADDSWTITGQKFIAVLGPRANERSIDFSALVKKIGAKAFALFATCTLKALEEKTAPEVAAQVVTWAATGPRSLKTFERGTV